MSSSLLGISVCGIIVANSSIISNDFEAKIEVFSLNFFVMSLGVIISFIS